MPIDSRTAAEVAKRHGLSLSDAQALAFLADTPAEAKELAAVFAPEQSSGDAPGALADKVHDRIRGVR